MAIDQIENDVGRVPGHFDHAPAEIRTEIGLHLVGVVFQPGIDLPAIAPRGAPAGLVALEHDDIGALFGEMQR